MSRLKLKRPLAVFDIEATGISPRVDRIIELCIIKLMPDGSRITHNWRINPEQHIPEEASAIHGIYDKDVADCPTFKQLANDIRAALDNCDLAGYNLTRYDIPMLCEEFKRAGVPFDTESRKVVDAQRIFHQKEPRDLEAALKFYCNREHVGAHGAEADVIATIDVLMGELDMYQDIPDTVEELDLFCNPIDPTWVDRSGRLKWQNGEVVLNFSQKKGQRLKDVAAFDSGFMKWILKSDFPQDTKKIVADALNGKYPEPPKGKEEKRESPPKDPISQIGEQLQLL